MAEYFKETYEFINKLNEELQERVSKDLPVEREDYASRIDEHVRYALKPFEWNRGVYAPGFFLRLGLKLITGKRDEVGNDLLNRMIKDFRCHEILVNLSVICGDEFLIEWGINYPFSKGGPYLSLPTTAYIQIVQMLSRRSKDMISGYSALDKSQQEEYNKLLTEKFDLLISNLIPHCMSFPTIEQLNAGRTLLGKETIFPDPSKI